MKRRNETVSSLLENSLKLTLLAALAAVMLMPLSIKAQGAEHAGNVFLAREPASDRLLPLPPLPAVDGTPWFTRESLRAPVKIDFLLAPPFEPKFLLAGHDAGNRVRSRAAHHG